MSIEVQDDFVARIQQRVDERLITLRQQESKRRNSEIALVVNENAKELRNVERMRKLTNFRLAIGILKEFKMAEKLKYINQNYWEGKGKLVYPTYSLGDKWENNEIMGVIELHYAFPNFKIEDDGEEHRNYRGRGMYRHKTKIVHGEGSTKLGVEVININTQSMFTSKEGIMTISESSRKALYVYSVKPYGDTVLNTNLVGSTLLGGQILVDAEDSETLVDSLLIEDIIQRRENGYSPKQIEEAVKRAEISSRNNLIGEWNYNPPGDC